MSNTLYEEKNIPDINYDNQYIAEREQETEANSPYEIRKRQLMEQKANDIQEDVTDEVIDEVGNEQPKPPEDIISIIGPPPQEPDGYKEWMVQKGLLEGKDPKELEYEWGNPESGSTTPLLDPVDIAVDIATGGTTMGAKAGWKFIKEGVKTGSKAMVKKGSVAIGRNMAEDVGLGMLATGFMGLADTAGGNEVVQIMSGILGPTATAAIITGTRKAGVNYIKTLAERRPELIDSLKKGLEKHKDHKLTKALFGESVDDVAENQAAVKKIQEGIAEEDKAVDDVIKNSEVNTGEDAIKVKKATDDETIKFIENEPRNVEKSININTNNINSEDDVINTIRSTSEIYGKQINDARRNKITKEVTGQLAEDLGMTTEQLLKRRKGQSFNAEEALAARKLMVSSADNLTELSKEVSDPLTRTPEKMLKFTKALTVHRAIQEQVAGMTAEAGRALQSFNIKSTSTEGKVKEINELINRLGDDESTEMIIKMLNDADNATKLNKAVDTVYTATTYEMFIEGWKGILLSGTKTQGTNFANNYMNLVWQPFERLVASMGSEVRTGESPQMLYALIESQKDAVKLLRSKSIAMSPKVGQQYGPKITYQNVKNTWWGQVIPEKTPFVMGVDYLGKAVRTPFTFLSKADDYAKFLGTRMELRSQAYRMAKNEGLSGAERVARMEEILSNPKKYAPNIEEDAEHLAKSVTYTEELKGFAKDFKKVAQWGPMKMVVPFYSVIVNIHKYTAKRTPIGFFMPSVKADLKAGGARRDLALARIGIGTSIGVMSYMGAAGGYVTGGGPPNRAQRQAKRSTGWQPYSLHIGDKYYSFASFEPFSTIMGISADLYEIGKYWQVDPDNITDRDMWDDAQQIGVGIVAAIGKNIGNKLFMKQINDMLDVILEPTETKWRRFQENYAKSFAPGFTAQLNQDYVDPTMREVRGAVDAFKSRIPGLSDDLPPVRDIWGDEIKYNESIGPNPFSRAYISEDKKDPVSNEVVRLQESLGHTIVNKPDKKLIFNGVVYDMNPKEYDQYLQYMTKTPMFAGKNMKEYMGEVMKEDFYKESSDEDKSILLNKIELKANQMASKMMYENDKDIHDKFNKRFKEKEQESLRGN